MEANVQDIYTGSMPVVVIQHEGQELRFSVSCFGKKSFTRDTVGYDTSFNVFREINAFWASLDKHIQDRIFVLYKQINLIFDDALDSRSLNTRLNDSVVELVNIHDFDYVKNWVMYRSGIQIPIGIKTEYQEHIDQKGSRDQTYIRSDYIDLITLALILRVMVPVWGEHILNNRKESGNRFKEYYAFKLLRHTNLINTPAYDKLRLYIDITVGEDKYSCASIINGISSEDFPEWMLALVSIRRLCVGDINGINIDPGATLVSSVWKFITQKTKPADSTGENAINKKEDTENTPDLYDKLSRLEWYKLKYRLTLGEMAEMELSVSDYRQVAQRLCPSMPNDVLERCIKTSKELMNHRLLECQLTIMRWVVKPVISARGVLYLNKELIVQLMGVTQAVLWVRGHQYLSLLSTSRIKISDNEYHVSSTEAKGRLTKEYIAELDKLFPYQKTPKTNKQPIIKPKATNLAIKSIDTLTDNLSMCSWIMTADEEFIAEYFGNFVTRRIAINPGIRNILAKLVIEISSRSWMM